MLLVKDSSEDGLLMAETCSLARINVLQSKINKKL
jgi:hypothetical protein